MSAQPHDAAPSPRPEPTIRSVRDRLDTDHRNAFNREIDDTPLHQIGEVLAVWDTRARAYADPATVAAVQEAEAYLRGETDLDVMSEEEIRRILPGLRP